MEFTNEFTIPTRLDEAFAILTDLERVAPCLPGATLQEVDGQSYSGQMRVKVGPMTMTYAGTAELTEEDATARTARIAASGRENRGAGTASADVRMALRGDGDDTVVTVVTDINVTGKPAQFGRGVMGDVGARIIDRFAENLREMLATQEASPMAADPSDDAVEGPSDGPRKIAHQPPRDEALDLMEVAGPAAAKRAVPVLVAALVILLVILWRRSQG